MDFDFEGVFDEDYLYFYQTWLTHEVSAEQTEKIAALLQLNPGAEILDLACGHGRISVQLAKLGFKVTGLDSSEFFLSKAREQAAGLEIAFVHGDMRDLPWSKKFDAVVNWFTAFGYFPDADNHRVLGEIHKVLKPGGTVLIDHQNRDRMLANFRNYSVAEVEDNFMIDVAHFDPVTGFATNDRIIIKDNNVRRTGYTVRMFAASELADWLRQAGLEQVRITDLDGEPFTVESRRMIARAVRP